MRGYKINEKVEVLPGGAALLTDENVMVVADMHLGCEASLEYEGLSLPRVQTSRILDHMLGLIDSVGPRKVIVAGDLKHNFSRNLTQEWTDVTRFVRTLRENVPLEVVRGNHDNYLPQILRGIGLSLRREIRLNGLKVIHGHEGRASREYTIMGHLHPSIVLRDALGASVKEPCFLHNEKRRILVLPAQSIVFPGADVVNQTSSDAISPLIAEFGLLEFEPVVFSGKKALEFPPIDRIRGIRSRA